MSDKVARVVRMVPASTVSGSGNPSAGADDTRGFASCRGPMRRQAGTAKPSGQRQRAIRFLAVGGGEARLVADDEEIARVERRDGLLGAITNLRDMPAAEEFSATAGSGRWRSAFGSPGTTCE